MKLSKYHTQIVAIVIGCLVIGIAIYPNTGVIDESISKFVKAFAMFFQAILYGVFAGGDNE